MKPEKINWCIWVSGYGEFEFIGTEAEAEDMRAYKARREGGQGRKWREDLSRESDRLTARIVALWDAGESVSPSLLRRLKKAKETDAPSKGLHE